MLDGGRPCSTFVVKEGFGTGKMMVIEVLICECTSVSLSPGINLRLGT